MARSRRQSPEHQSSRWSRRGALNVLMIMLLAIGCQRLQLAGALDGQGCRVVPEAVWYDYGPVATASFYGLSPEECCSRCLAAVSTCRIWLYNPESTPGFTPDGGQCVLLAYEPVIRVMPPNIRAIAGLGADMPGNPPLAPVPACAQSATFTVGGQNVTFALTQVSTTVTRFSYTVFSPETSITSFSVQTEPWVVGDYLSNSGANGGTNSSPPPAVSEAQDNGHYLRWDVNQLAGDTLEYWVEITDLRAFPTARGTVRLALQDGGSDSVAMCVPAYSVTQTDDDWACFSGFDYQAAELGEVLTLSNYSGADAMVGVNSSATDAVSCATDCLGSQLLLYSEQSQVVPVLNLACDVFVFYTATNNADPSRNGCRLRSVVYQGGDLAMGGALQEDSTVGLACMRRSLWNSYKSKVPSNYWQIPAPSLYGEDSTFTPTSSNFEDGDRALFAPPTTAGDIVSLTSSAVSHTRGGGGGVYSATLLSYALGTSLAIIIGTSGFFS